MLIVFTAGSFELGVRLTRGEIPSTTEVANGQPTTGAAPIANISSHAHRAAGVVVLLAGVVALLAAKGRLVHRVAGRIYVGSVMVLAVFILPMLLASPSGLHVLTMLAVYLTVSGAVIALKLKRLAPKTAAGERTLPLKVADGVAVIAGVALLGGGLGALWAGEAGVPETPLALLAVALALYDLSRIARGGVFVFRSGSERIHSHALRMVGSVVVLLSANFYAVTTATDTLPPAMRWLIPAVASAAALIAVPYVFGIGGRRAA